MTFKPAECREIITFRPRLILGEQIATAVTEVAQAHPKEYQLLQAVGKLGVFRLFSDPKRAQGVEELLVMEPSRRYDGAAKPIDPSRTYPSLIIVPGALTATVYRLDQYPNQETYEAMKIFAARLQTKLPTRQ